MSVFLVDTNFFIQAHRAIYPLDVAVSFWRKVSELAEAQKIISIDKVRNEIYQNEDELKQWCEDHLPPEFFKSTNTIIGEYSRVATWASSMSHHYKPTALTEFLDADEADAWLVSFALNQGIPLITYEKSEPNSKKKIKIPDVCNHFGVHYMSTIDMFRSLRESF
jgi:hypothetical protein